MDVSNFEDDFERAVADWRERHRLREDDPVLLLLDLFRIHQRHWDDIRRREMPSFEGFRGDIAKLVETSRSFRQHAATLTDQLKRQPGAGRPAMVTRTAAWLAALAGGFAGYLLGRAWL